MKKLVGSAQFTHMKLRSDDDVRTIFSIFGQYITRGQIEMDTS